jgi:hypothetical protein
MMVLAAAAALTTSPPAATNMAASSVSNSGAQLSSSPAAPAKAQSATAQKVYCTSGTISGSRIVKRECKTKDQWAKDGVDVNDLMNSEQE